MVRWLLLTVVLGSASVLADDAGASFDGGVDVAAALAGPVPTLDLQTGVPPDYQGDGPGMGTLLLQTAVGLGLVVSLIYLTLNVGLRKLLGIRPVGAGRSKVSVLERVALDQKRVLFVVRAGKEVLLVGGAEENLTLISKLDAADFPPEEVAASGGPGLQMSPFLKKLLGRKEAPKANTP